MTKQDPSVQLRAEIAVASQEAVRLIAQAAQDAGKLVANAAIEARQVITNHESEAAKIVIAKANDGSSDHDFLLTFSSEVKTKLDGIATDIKDLKNGTESKINDHEVRLNALEGNNTKLTVLLSVGAGIMTLLVSLLVYHLFQG